MAQTPSGSGGARGQKVHLGEQHSISCSAFGKKSQGGSRISTVEPLAVEAQLVE
jgi:hypothetical protein